MRIREFKEFRKGQIIADVRSGEVFKVKEDKGLIGEMTSGERISLKGRSTEEFVLLKDEPAVDVNEADYSLDNGRFTYKGEDIETGTLKLLRVLTTVPGRILFVAKSREEDLFDIFAYVLHTKKFAKVKNAIPEPKLAFPWSVVQEDEFYSFFYYEKYRKETVKDGEKEVEKEVFDSSALMCYRASEDPSSGGSIISYITLDKKVDIGNIDVDDFSKVDIEGLAEEIPDEQVKKWLLSHWKKKKGEIILFAPLKDDDLTRIVSLENDGSFRELVTIPGEVIRSTTSAMMLANYSPVYGVMTVFGNKVCTVIGREIYTIPLDDSVFEQLKIGEFYVSQVYADSKEMSFTLIDNSHSVCILSRVLTRDRGWVLRLEKK